MKIWNRRNRTIALGAAPVVVLVTLLGLPSIPGTDIDLTVPYAAEGKGPTFNTLGEEGGKQVVEVTGAETSKPAGHLNMTTVSVHTKLTLGQALARWLTTDDTLVPIGQIFPANKSPAEVQQQNQAAFAASESNATTAAMNYLNKPLETPSSTSWTTRRQRGKSRSTMSSARSVGAPSQPPMNSPAWSASTRRATRSTSSW